MTSRREFIAALGAPFLSAVTIGHVQARPEIKWGYASITWGGRDLEAIDDIASLGFAGIQLRANVLQQFGDRPQALRELLASKKLSLVALSSGAVTLNPAAEQQMIADHIMRARFVRDVGGSYLQVTDQKPSGRPVVAEDFTRLGRLLTEIGRRSADLGIPLGYHNHMGTIGEAPADVDRVLEACDARYVRFELDIAHYHQGGGNPADAIRRHKDRLLFLHIKDVERPAPGRASGSPTYRFVELGRGVVDIKGVVTALNEVNFRGWSVVELDAVPPAAPARTPKESAAISKRYLEEIGVRVT